MGSWSAAGVANQSVTVLAGIQNAVGDRAKILYAKGANITNDKDIVDFLNLYEEAVKIDPRSPQAMIDEAVQAAKQADMVVAVVGESQGMAHEASSRTNITIPQSQRDLITALKATGKPLVLVLMNGRPLALVKEDQQADAILETWFAGTEGGNAIADVLFGDYNPSGNRRSPSRVRWDKFRSITAISIRDARIILKSQTNTPHVILTKRMARSIRLVTV